jgi:hypothetical protein
MKEMKEILNKIMTFTSNNNNLLSKQQSSLKER